MLLMAKTIETLLEIIMIAFIVRITSLFYFVYFFFGVVALNQISDELCIALKH